MNTVLKEKKEKNRKNVCSQLNSSACGTTMWFHLHAMLEISVHLFHCRTHRFYQLILTLTTLSFLNLLSSFLTITQSSQLPFTNITWNCYSRSSLVIFFSFSSSHTSPPNQSGFCVMVRFFYFLRPLLTLSDAFQVDPRLDNEANAAITAATPATRRAALTAFKSARNTLGARINAVGFYHQCCSQRIRKPGNSLIPDPFGPGPGPIRVFTFEISISSSNSQRH